MTKNRLIAITNDKETNKSCNVLEEAGDTKRIIALSCYVTSDMKTLFYPDLAT